MWATIKIDLLVQTFSSYSDPKLLGLKGVDIVVGKIAFVSPIPLCL